MIIGYLDHFTGGHILGWMGSLVDDAMPFITANGKPCLLKTNQLQRDDVAAATGLHANVGFIAEVPHTEYSEIVFELYAITTSGKKLIDQKTFIGAAINPKRFCSVFDALDIARQQDAVAIACWDGTHNAMSRAFTLYNIVRHSRPAVIIAFDIGFSSHNIWPPLINSNAKVLIIPWKERAIYFDLFRHIGLSFNTVWICDQRYPSFELTKNISNQNTSFILDLDSNESPLLCNEDFNSKHHGKLSSLMAQRFAEQIFQRSSACTIQQAEFNTLLIRHARSMSSTTRERQTAIHDNLRIGFVGTVTPHKGLIEAAKIINFINRTYNYKIRLVVAGEFSTDALKSELGDLGCELHNYVDLNNLNKHIENLDLVLTGFPNPNIDHTVAKNQIPSIIGDALANSRPVLVPVAPSAIDLEGIEGIYLFTLETFLPVLQVAVARKSSITLDNQFTIDYNYQIFSQLELAAQTNGPKFTDLFDYYDTIERTRPISTPFQLKNIVLIWKQHDSGLYGRRVDQMARSFTTSKFAENIFSLEIITREHIHCYQENSDRIDSDHQYIYSDFFEKKIGMLKDGVFHQSLLTDGSESFATTFNRFLIRKGIFPSNTIFINFPAITDFSQLLTLLDGYKKITDIVDNQLSWETKNPLPLITQYLSFTGSSDEVIFNSEKNMNFFIESGLSNKEQSFLVPNWYSLPTSFITPAKQKTSRHLKILYSGNMNDRIDWSLLELLHDTIDDNVRIHLVGSADKSADELTRILEERKKFIYHGPMRESELLDFAATCHLAVMPHLHDKHSTFMNPMKLNMYTAIGLACVSTDIPGIDKSNPYLTVCKTSTEFIQQTLKLLSTEPTPPLPRATPSYDVQYIELIKNLASS